MSVARGGLFSENLSSYDLALRGDVDTLEKVLHSGAELNLDQKDWGVPSESHGYGRRFFCGDTPLMAAIFNGHEKMVRYLLDQKVDVTARNFYTNTALIIASMYGRETMIDLLLDVVPDDKREEYLNAPGLFGRTALHTAAQNGHVGVVRRLLARGARQDLSDRDKKTPLIAALEAGHQGVVDCLQQMSSLKCRF